MGTGPSRAIFIRIFCIDNLFPTSLKPEERDHSENIGVDGRVLLNWILGK
jgi:hypothetical protein